MREQKSVIRTRKRRTEKNKNWFLMLQRFCNVTSLHGFHFLIENEVTLLERVFWILALCLVYICCAILIRNNVLNWLTSPPVMSMENTPTTVAFVPFPAVTVCNINQIKSPIFNFSVFSALKEQLRTINQTFLSQLDYISIFCQKELNDKWKTDILDMNVFYYMINNAHESCEETFSTIKWTNESFSNPCEFIQPILTDLGICFSFNMLPFGILLKKFYFNAIQFKSSNLHFNNWSKSGYTNWTPETGYGGKPISAHDQPRRTAGVGNFYAYTASLNLNFDNYDESCNQGKYGYTILVHSPADFPSSVDAKVVINNNSQQAIIVQQKRIHTSAEIKNWTPMQRGCYFDDERQLYYFQFYTQNNCNIECESNYSLKQCGCVAFYHPRSLLTPVCGSLQMDCIEDSLVRLAEFDSENLQRCNCLPSCNSFQYDCITTTASFMSKYKNTSSTQVVNSNNTKINQNESERTECMFTVYYLSRDTVGTVRVGLLTFSTFLGNIGGILGLFLGFSFISLLEIFYFSVIQPLAKFRKNCRNIKEQLPKLRTK